MTAAIEESVNPLASDNSLEYAFSLGGTGVVDTRKAILTSLHTTIEWPRSWVGKYRFLRAVYLAGGELMVRVLYK